MAAPYQNPLSVTSQFSFCGLPFRLDTYSGCAFSCTYCFARLRGGNFASTNVRCANPDSIITRFKKAISLVSEYPGIITEYIQHQVPLHFGGMSDPFQPLERKKKVSLKVLKYLCSINYPIVISTKSDLISEEPYLSLLRSNAKILIQFSFSTTIGALAQIVEPFSTPPIKLLKTIEILSNNGIKTSVRWQPYIPQVSESPKIFIDRVSKLGIKHIGLEHLKLPFENNNPLILRLHKNVQFDLRKFYKERGCNDGREFILPAKEKIELVMEVKSELRNHNITFGAADNDLQFLSDTHCCCSGADQFSEFETWNKFQIAHAVKKSNGGKIKFDLIKDEWHPKGSIDQYINSKSRIPQKEGHNTVMTYIKNRWENLDSPFNPTAFYGVIYKGERDSNGNRIFEWEKKV